jgi:ubiquinone biosynthesis protein
LPGDLVLLARMLVTLDGTVRTLTPELSIVNAVSELMAPSDDAPVVDPGTMLRDELLAVVPHLRRLPDRVDRMLMLAGRGKLRIRTVLDEDGSRVVRTLVNRMLLAVIGFSFLLVAAVLLVATNQGPEVAADVGLFEIFGYGGIFAGTVLLLRVAAAVARDGTT